MAGYSSTPLIRKLGIKPGFAVFVKDAPMDYEALVGGLPEGTRLMEQPAADLDMIHLFTTSRETLASDLAILKGLIRQSGMIWVSWPKKASKVATDVSDDEIRNIALRQGLVDIKVCAVDDRWSGLKLVIRKENRR